MAKQGASAQKAEIGKGYQLVPVVGPSAGLDLRTAPTLLPPEKARTLTNFSLAEPGALTVRKGYQAFSTTSLGASRIQGGMRAYLVTAVPSQTSTIVTVIGWNQKLYTLTDSGGWSASVLSGLSTRELGFVSDRDLMAVFDGSTTAYKSTNGSSWTRLGVIPPSSASILSSLSTGGLSSGDYEINFTYKDRDLAVESNGSSSPSTITITATSGAINVIVPNSTEAQVDAFVVYARKVSAGETVRRFVSSQAQSAGTSSTVVVTSTVWTTNREEPTDHTIPGSLSFGVVWKNRWWARDATVTNRIHFSQLFQPQSWPALFYIDIPFEHGDAIQALVPLGDTLLIFGTTKIFLILGTTSLDFEVRPTVASEDGALGPRAVARLENGLVHAAASGIYVFDGFSDKLLSFDIDPGWQDLMANGAASDIAKVALVYHKKEKELRVAVPRRYPSGADGEWVLDLNRTRQGNSPAWSATDRAIGGYILFDGPETSLGNQGRLFSWDSTNGRVFEESVLNAGANSSNLTAEYEGAALTLGPYIGRWIDVRGQYEPHAGNWSINPIVDGVSQGTMGIPMTVSGATYGSGLYGTAVYGGGINRKQFYKMLPLAAMGRTFVLKGTYTGKEQFRFFTYHVGLVPETKSRGLSDN